MSRNQGFVLWSNERKTKMKDKTNKLPGFTAEDSLPRVVGHPTSGIAGSEGAGDVRPQFCMWLGRHLCCWVYEGWHCAYIPVDRLP
jgi:hypothetical protein